MFFKSKRLTPNETRPQAKVTIVGTDRVTFASVLTMALKRYISEIVIYDPLFNQQIKCCFQDVG